MPDRFTPIQPGTDASQQMAMINNNFAKLDQEATIKTYYNAEGNLGLIEGQLPNGLGTGTLVYGTDQVPRIAMYIDSSGNPVLKVAKAGNDVTTAANDNLVFNSAQNIFKIVKTGTASLAVPSPFLNGASVTATIAHGLSAAPAFLAYVNIPPGSGIYGTGLGHVPAFTMGSGAVTSYVQGTTDATNLYLTVTNVFGANLSGAPFGSTWTLRYYVLQESAT